MKRQIFILFIFIKCNIFYGFGVDFGGEYIKGTYLVPGKGFNFIEDDMAKKKSPSAIAFCSRQKFQEYQGFMKFLKNKCDTIRYVSRFLLNKNDQENLMTILSDDLELIEDEIGQLVLFSENNFPQLKSARIKDNKVLMRVEELISMQLQKQKINIDRVEEQKFNEIVLTIPSNDLSIIKRMMLFSAIKLAKLKPLALVSENTAAMVQYAFNRSFEKSFSQVKLIVNVGALNTKVSLIRLFTTTEIMKNKKELHHPTIKVLKEFSSFKFSGKVLNYCLGKDFLNSDYKFVNRKLLDQIQNSKEVLSVNKQTRFNFLDYPQPISELLTQENFEILCQDQFDIFQQILLDFQQSINLQDEEEIHDIEIIGGGTRIPKIQQIIKLVFDVPLKSHIDGDLGSALGTAIIAANLSEGVKTKKIIVQDGPRKQYKIRVDLQDGSEVKETIIFTTQSYYDEIKKISLKNIQSNFIVQIINDEEQFEQTYQIKGVGQKIPQNESSTIKTQAILTFKLNHFGLVNFYEVILKIITKQTNEKGQEKEKEIKENLVIVEKNISYKSLFENKEEYALSQRILKELDNSEKIRIQKIQVKNELEKYLYKIEDIVEIEEEKKYLQDKEVLDFEKKIKSLQEIIEKINEYQHEDLTMELNKVKMLLKPFEERKQTYENNKNMKEQIKKSAHELNKKLNSIRIKNNWIEKEKIDKIRNKISKFEKELIEKVKTQSKHELNVDPLVTNSLINEREKKILRMITTLEKMKKPSKSDKPGFKNEDL